MEEELEIEERVDLPIEMVEQEFRGVQEIAGKQAIMVENQGTQETTDLVQVMEIQEKQGV